VKISWEIPRKRRVIEKVENLHYNHLGQKKREIELLTTAFYFFSILQLKKVAFGWVANLRPV
jgi:hypothetical protein